MIALLLALLVAGYYWARETTLDLITRGEGRLIAEGQNKLVQAPSGGVVTDILVTVSYTHLTLPTTVRV